MIDTQGREHVVGIEQRPYDRSPQKRETMILRERWHDAIDAHAQSIHSGPAPEPAPVRTSSDT